MSTSDVFATAEEALRNFGYNSSDIFLGCDYLYAIGDCPIALIAHIDTVFDKPPEHLFFDSEQNIGWSPDGLGADDRLGIAIIFETLKYCDKRPSIILLDGEESGGWGAEELVRDFKKPFSKLNYLIEIDRMGTNDAVFYWCGNKEFKKYIIDNTFFKEAKGTFTDISIIGPAWNVAAVNLSTGYIKEHTLLEHYSAAAAQRICEEVIKLLNLDNSKRFKHDSLIFYKDCKVCKRKVYNPFTDTHFWCMPVTN